MKKRPVFVIITLSLVLSLFTSGCGTKKASYVGRLFVDKSETAEGESQKAAEHKSLIAKYVRNSGEPYIAHDYMMEKGMTAKHLAEEWLDTDGKLRLPFDPDDIKEIDKNSYAETTAHERIFMVDGTEHYYIPDEVAVNASTEELADVFISYGYNGGLVPSMLFGRESLESIYEHNFVLLLSNSNALEESLRRNDFVKVYYEKYMTESENMPERYDGGNNRLYFVLSNKTETLDVIEVLLAQPESYEQLTKKQRESLVRRVLKREIKGEQGELLSRGGNSKYWTNFFTCIAGEAYLPADMAAIPDATLLVSKITGGIERDNNPWLKTISAMDFTEEEQKILEKYFVVK